jgi:S1-C subfamily serine protease
VDVAPLPAAVRQALRLKNGVVVERVWSEAFAAAPDLQPGDVVLQVGTEYVATPEEFAQAWDSQEPGGRARFLISRGSRRIVRRTEVPGRDCRPDGATPRELPLLGSAVRWSPAEDRPGREAPGFRLLLVPPDSRAAGAGLEAGDVLVAVDGKPLSWPDARRLLVPWTSRHEPVLTVRRGGGTRLTVLPEEAEEPEGREE